VPLDVARIRGLVPALGDGWVHFDASAGMQAPEQVVSALTTALRTPQAVPGAPFPASRHAAALEDDARCAVADVVGADPAGVVLGPCPAVLLGRLADALSARWELGDGLVVSRLEEAAHVAPWLCAAQHRGVAVRWAEIEIETCELPTWQFDELLTDGVRVVALTAASAQVGTRPDVDAIAAAARRGGAFLVADLSAAAAFGPQDLGALGADVVALDATAWGGPPVGALAFRDPAVLDDLPACWSDPSARGAHRLEIGPLPTAQLAGLVASIEHLAGLDESAFGTRRARLLTSMASLADHHALLLDDLLDGLLGSAITVLGSPARRVPLLSLTHDSAKAPDVVEHLAAQRICAYADPGDRGVLANVGSAEVGGAVRIGFAHSTTRAEVAALVDALTSLR